MSYADRLAALEPACSTGEALALYDDLPAVRFADLRDRPPYVFGSRARDKRGRVGGRG